MKDSRGNNNNLMNRAHYTTYYLLILIMGLLLSACMHRNLEPAKYIKWIEDPENGLKKEKTIGDYIFTIQYRPYEYIALKELTKNDVLSKQYVKNIVNTRKDFHYLIIQIASKDNQTPMLKNRILSEKEYFDRLNYFVSYAQNDLVLIDGKDTLHCSLYHFEQTYNIAPFDRLITAFQMKQAQEHINDLTLIYNDNVLGVGKVKIIIDKSDLKRIPKLHI